MGEMSFPDTASPIVLLDAGSAASMLVITSGLLRKDTFKFFTFSLGRICRYYEMG